MYLELDKPVFYSQLHSGDQFRFLNVIDHMGNYKWFQKTRHGYKPLTKIYRNGQEPEWVLESANHDSWNPNTPVIVRFKSSQEN